MKLKWAIISLAILGICFAARELSKKQVNPIPQVVQAPTSKSDLPDVNFQEFSGKNLSLSSLKGHVILLNFWASWCPPCLEEFPSMLDLTLRSKGKIQLVAVSGDADEQAVQSFLYRWPALQEKIRLSPNIHIVLDKHGKITAESFAVLRYPESLVIDEKYQIIRKFVGPVNWLSPEVLSFFDAI